MFRAKDYPINKAKYGLSYACEIGKASSNKGSNVRAVMEIQVNWEPSTEEWVVLNTDGVYKASLKLASCGGVLRNHRGEWMDGFSVNLGCCSALRVEICDHGWMGTDLAGRISSSGVANRLQGSHFASSYSTILCPFIVNVINSC